MYFHPIASQTNSHSLDEVLTNLSHQEIVEAVLTLGSTATGKQTANSDYDLLVILREMPFPMQVVLTTINGRLADILFASSNLLTRILQNEPDNFTPYEAIVKGHLFTGKIVHDGNGRLQKIRNNSQDSHQPPTPSDEEIYYRVIHGINFNYQHNERYYSNREPLHQMVLTMRLSYSIDQIVFGYFLIRKLVWQGEKKAIQYWQENDPVFLDSFQQYFSTADLDEKFRLYTQLAQLTLAPVDGLWPDNNVNIVLDSDWTIEDIPKAIDYWHTISTKP